MVVSSADSYYRLQSGKDVLAALLPNLTSIKVDEQLVGRDYSISS